MKKQVWKRLLSAGLIGALLCCAIPVGAVGEDHTGDPNWVYTDGQWYATGLVLDESVPDYLPPAPQTRAALPSSVDLSTTNYFPPVGDQGSLGSCTSFATTHYAFTYEAAKLNDWDVKNNSSYQFSPRWTYSFINGGDGGGTSFEDNYRVLHMMGCVKESQFPYSDTNYTTRYTNTSGMRDALKVRVSDWNYHSFAPASVNTPIRSASSSYLTNLKQRLADGHVFNFQTNINGQYKQTSNGYGKAIAYNSTDGGSHAMTIVGYNDNVQCDINGDGVISTAEKGAFKMVNSWGDDWQNDGFCWIMYDALNKVSALSGMSTNRIPMFYNYGYFTVDVENYKPHLIAEITMNNVVSSTQNNEIDLKVGASDLDENNPRNYGINTSNSSDPDYKDFVRIFQGVQSLSQHKIILDFDPAGCDMDGYTDLYGNKWYVGAYASFAGTSGQATIYRLNSDTYVQEGTLNLSNTSARNWKEKSLILEDTLESYSKNNNILRVSYNSNATRVEYNLLYQQYSLFGENLHVCGPTSSTRLDGQTQLKTGDRVYLKTSNKYVPIAVLGDVDGDGKVTITDQMQISRFMQGATSDDVTMEAADINGDGRVNAFDQMELSKIMQRNNLW